MRAYPGEPVPQIGLTGAGLSGLLQVSPAEGQNVGGAGPRFGALPGTRRARALKRRSV